MKTIILNKRTFTSMLSSLVFATFITSASLFTSCSEDASINGLSIDDAALIEKIESASKLNVDASTLPTAAKVVFTQDLADSFVETVQFASGLGFKVAVFTDNESKLEAKSDVYFSTEGKQLNDTNEKRILKRQKCFEFVFPVDFIMPDDTSITLESKDDWILIREWFQANPGTKERPELVFPVDITLEDGTVVTLVDRDDLKAIKDACKENRDKRKCFEFDFPVTFTMADATEITITERADFKLIREWHKANPTIKEKGMINFPVTIIYRDGTTEEITDEAALIAAKVSCRK